MHRNQRPATIGELQTMMERFRSPHESRGGTFDHRSPHRRVPGHIPQVRNHLDATDGRTPSGVEAPWNSTRSAPWFPGWRARSTWGRIPKQTRQWAPRLFKVHLNGKAVPPGGRYVVVFRDPKAVVVSFHRFFDGTYFEAGAIDVETFAREWFMGGTVSGRYWSHLLSWWPKVGGSDTLALAYEDMVEDHRGTVALLADFLGFGGDDDLDRHRRGTLDSPLHDGTRPPVRRSPAVRCHARVVGIARRGLGRQGASHEVRPPPTSPPNWQPISTPSGKPRSPAPSASSPTKTCAWPCATARHSSGSDLRAQSSQLTAHGSREMPLQAVPDARVVVLQRRNRRGIRGWDQRIPRLEHERHRVRRASPAARSDVVAFSHAS